MENKTEFEFSIKGTSVADLKEIMTTEFVKVDVEKPVIHEVEKIVENLVEKEVKTHRTHCPICESKRINWFEPSSDYEMAGMDGQSRWIQQGNCENCGIGTQRERRGTDE